MYAPYFGLRQEPFSIAPDPRYLFMSERHREALAHLLYGLSAGGGFVLLTGEIGAGKTTVCRAFLEQVPAHCNVAYVFNPKLTALELLQTVCDEFGVAVPRSGSREATIKEYVDPLNAFLLAQHAAGRINLLVIDEAQNLSADVLEQLRLLTNLETAQRKLLQVVLVGQPELRDMLARPELEQLAQRVIARYHLGPLDEADTARYVQHRLAVAGLERVPPFERGVVRRIHRLSRGVPRRINLLCDRALLGAYARGRATVSRALLEQAGREVFDARPAPAHRRLARNARWAGVALAGLAVVGAAAWWAVAPLPQAAWFASEPAAAPPAPAAPGLAIRVASEAGATSQPIALLQDRDEAWRELAAAWGVELAPGANACGRLAAQGLQCFSSPMSLSLIRQLQRPGVLTLDGRGAAPVHALLVALGPDSATLRASGREQVMPLQALAARWQGDFSTLWRAPEGAGGPRAQAWATQLLAQDDPPGAVTASLAARLRTFQLAQGLPATGTLAPTTFMQLNRLAGLEEPRLRAQP